MVDLEKDGPRELFPDFEKYHGDAPRRAYVEREVEKLIASGEFYLTECILQPVGVADFVGDCILGRGYDREGEYIQAPVADAVAEHKVHLRPVDGDVAIYANGRVSKWPAMRGMRTKENRLETSTPKRAELREGDYSLSKAWQVLKQCGKNVKYAGGPGAQKKRWRVEEIPPWRMVDAGNDDGDRGTKAKVGRPRKADAGHGNDTVVPVGL